MPQTRGNLAQVPVNSDTFNLTADLSTMADSLEVIVPVANDSAGDTVGTSRASAGFAVSDARPLFIFNQATQTVRWKGTAGVWSEFKNSLKHAEYTFAAVSQTANNGTLFGAATLDTGSSFNNSFSSVNASQGTLNILETGVYIITSWPQPPSSLGSQVHIFGTNSSQGTIMSTNFESYGNAQTIVTVLAYLPSGTTCSFGITGTNTLSGILARVRLTKIMDA